METTNANGIIKYGYWFDDTIENAMYPVPQVGTVKDIELINKLEEIINRIERGQVYLSNCDYLEMPIGNLNGHIVIGSGVKYMGCSKCRICGIINGDTEYILKNDIVLIHIPQGLLHYLKEHNIEHNMDSIVSKIDLDIELVSDVMLNKMKSDCLSIDMYSNIMKMYNGLASLTYSA